MDTVWRWGGGGGGGESGNQDTVVKRGDHCTVSPPVGGLSVEKTEGWTLSYRPHSPGNN